MAVVYANAAVAAPVCGLLAVLAGDPQRLAAATHLHNVRFGAAFLASCCLGGLLAFSAVLSTTKNSPLATSVTGNAKGVAVTGLGWLFFGAGVGSGSSSSGSGGLGVRAFAGVALSLYGAAWYSALALARQLGWPAPAPGAGAAGSSASSPAAIQIPIGALHQQPSDGDDGNGDGDDAGCGADGDERIDLFTTPSKAKARRTVTGGLLSSLLSSLPGFAGSRRKATETMAVSRSDTATAAAPATGSSLPAIAFAAAAAVTEDHCRFVGDIEAPSRGHGQGRGHGHGDSHSTADRPILGADPTHGFPSRSHSTSIGCNSFLLRCWHNRPVALRSCVRAAALRCLFCGSESH